MADKGGGGGATIIIKKKKGGHGAAHGGAWKIAYADFVTAMMAFFLLLWLLNAVTQEQLEGISNYFAPVAPSKSQSGSGDIGGGKVAGEQGALETVASRPKVTMDLPPPKAGQGSSEQTDQAPENVSKEQAEEILKKKEEEQFQDAEKTLRDAIDSQPNLKQLAKSLLIDNTAEGLRIQIVDQEGLAMFPRGGAELYLHTKKVLELVAKVIQAMPQKIAVSGHTDATKYAPDAAYTNWELSADRANAARRYLVHLGIGDDRLSRVVGKAESDPLRPEDPGHPSNRRLSIVLMRGSGPQGAAAKPKPEVLPGLQKAREATGGVAQPPPSTPLPQPPAPALPPATFSPGDSNSGAGGATQQIIIPLKPAGR
ncbi:MAG: flagellar motor protein MotB [Magnetospirillum sp. WYHS-4]